MNLSYSFFKKAAIGIVAIVAIAGFGVSLCHADATSSTSATNAITVVPGSLAGGSTDAACLDGSGNAVPGCYVLNGGLGEAIGNKLGNIDTRNGLGGFINSLVAFAIGIGGVLAVAMIMYEGFLYMAAKKDGNPEKVGGTKSKITNTVIGFLLLLSVYVILRTVNPDLLNLTPRLDSISVAIPPSSDNENQSDNVKNNTGTQNSGAGFNMQGSFASPVANAYDIGFIPGVAALKAGATIDKIVVNVGSGSQTDGRIVFYLSNGTNVSSAIKTGWKGVAETGQAQSGDNKTPKGSYTLGGVAGDGTVAPIYKATDQNHAVIANGYNYGAGFFGLNADPSGRNRYIGIHGKADDVLGTTNGCIRMYNDELVMIAPFIHSGIPVLIQ